MEQLKRKLESNQRGLDQKLPLYHRLLGIVQKSFGSTVALQVELPQDEDGFLTNRETFMNVLNCAFGTGCLAMPLAFMNAGWLTGLILTIVVAFFVVSSMHVLLNDINAMEKRFGVTLLSYGESMEVAVGHGPRRFQFLAKAMHVLVDILLSLYNFGVDCVYVVFIGKILKNLGDLYFWPLDERLYMALLLPPLMMTFVIRKFRRLVPFIFVSNLMIAIGCFITLSYLVRDLPDFSEIRPTQPLKNFPLVFGTLLYSTESVGVMLALRRSMRTPADFLGTCGILNRGMAVVTLFYAGFGFFGYWHFGQDTASSVLHNLPSQEIPIQIVAGLFGLGIFLTYGQQGYVTVDIIWSDYMKPEMEEDKSAKAVEWLVQMALVIASVLVAIQLPDFGLLLSLVGSLCMAQLGLILPSIVDLCIRYEDGYGPGRILLWRSMIFIAGGLAGGIAGTWATLPKTNDEYSIRM